MSEWRTKYSDQGDIQLKLLAEYFEKSFSKAPVIVGEFHELEDPFWVTKDVPFSVLPSALVDVVGTWIGGVPEQTIWTFAWFLLDTFLQNELKTPKDRTLNGTGLWALLQVVIRKFPYSLGKIVPQIQAKFMTKTKTGYLLRKPEHTYILELLGNALQTNPRIALYCWFELLLPTLVNPATEQSMCEIAIKFIEVLDSKYNRKSFKASVGNADTFSTPEGIVVLTQVLNSTVRQKTIQPRLRAVYQKIIEITIFSNANYPRLYFATLLPLVVQLQEGETQMEEDGNEDNKGPKMSLNILALSLLLDSQCHKLLINNYTQYQPQTMLILEHVAAKWNKLTSSVDSKRLQDATQELINTCNKLIEINDSILNNKYFVDGKQLGIKTCGFTRDQLEASNITCQNLIKPFQKVAKTQRSSGGASRYSIFFYFCCYNFLFCVVPAQNHSATLCGCC